MNAGAVLITNCGEKNFNGHGRCGRCGSYGPDYAKKGEIPKRMNLEAIVNDLLSDIPI